MGMMEILLLLVILIPVFLSIIFTPYWTRKTESFGVSIPEEIYFNEELKEMRKRYTWFSGILSIVMIVIFILFSTMMRTEESVSIAFSIALILYLIFTFLIYLVFHKKMKRMKAQHNWEKTKTQQLTIHTEFRNQKLTYSNLWFIVPLLLAFTMILLSVQFYDRIPDRIPTKYNLAGEVTNWMDKSYRTVLMMPIMQVYLTLLFLFINVVIAKAKQQIHATNPEDSLNKNVRFRRRWSLYTIISGLALNILFAVIQASYLITINQQVVSMLSIIITIGMVLGAILLAFTTGQGGSRLTKAYINENQSIDRDDDKYWKLGQFYFNKEDPALFLEKRFGIGWTINLARPTAWILLLTIILLPIGIPYLLGM